jgi:hypothetical protein
MVKLKEAKEKLDWRRFKSQSKLVDTNQTLRGYRNLQAYRLISQAAEGDGSFKPECVLNLFKGLELSAKRNLIFSCVLRITKKMKNENQNNFCSGSNTDNSTDASFSDIVA